MNNLEATINHCLTLIKGSKVTALKKMRMEVQLTKLRMHKKPVSVVFEEDFISAVVLQLNSICLNNNEEESLTDLIVEIDRLLQSLADKPLSGKVDSGAKLFDSVTVGIDTNTIVAPQSDNETR